MKKINSSKARARLQENTAKLALFLVGSLAIGKFIIAGITSSMSILASAIDSIMDLAASGINLFSIKKSLEPADHDHHYGHGKAESLASFLQSLLMFASSIYIIYSSVQKWIHKSTLTRIDLGIGVMLCSSILSFFLYRRLKQVSEQCDSIVLKADSVNYSTDVLTNLGVFISLWIILMTNFVFIDFIISIMISLYINWAAYKIFRESVDILMDKSLPENQIKNIHNILQSFYPDIDSYHSLKTRKAGFVIFIDLHTVMPKIKSLEKAHKVAEKLILGLQEKFPDAQINIHIDPNDDRLEITNKGGGIHAPLELEKSNKVNHKGRKVKI